MNINISDSSQYKQIHYYNLELGQCIGDYSLVYNIPSTESSSDNIAPSRISVIYKGEKIVDSGFIGGISYNYELEKLGLPLVSSSQLNGEIIFNKSITEPTFAKLIIETPFINSNISVTLMCPCDNGSGSDSSSDSGSDSGSNSGSDSGSDCSGNCQCILDWNLDNCIDVTISPCYEDDGNLPEEPYPESISLKISNQIYINGILFEYSILDGLWKNGYDTLTISSGLFALNINGNISYLKPKVRYRRLYDDYTIVDFYGYGNPDSENVFCSDATGFFVPCCGGSPCSSVSDVQNNPNIVSPLDNPNWQDTNPDLNLYCQSIGCGAGGGPVPFCISYVSYDEYAEYFEWTKYNISFQSTCRTPDLCPSTAACRNIVELSSLNQIPGPDDKCYCVGGGRPIDIDIHCDGTIRPETSYFSPSTTGFTLWFEPRGQAAVPIIDNILYDTTQLSTTLDIVKVHTTTTAEEMREWVCKNLRFATVIDYNIINSDIDNAIKSNWPYNDLYWEARCTGYPAEDVPINLVPC